MGSPYADDFLSCVLKRTENDRIIGVASMLLALLIVPLMVVLGILILKMRFHADIYLHDIIGLELVMAIVTTFFVYRILDTVNAHRIRDRTWAEALIGYASEQGHDVSGLESMVSGISEDRIGLITKAAFVFFLVVFAVNMTMIFLIMGDVLGIWDSEYIFIAFAIAIYIELGAASVYAHIKITEHDRIQSKFTAALSDMLDKDIGSMGPLDAGLKDIDLRIHVLAMVLTLGLYALVFAVLTVRRIRQHISSEWAYEEDLLRKIVAKESAIGVSFVDKERGKGFRRLFRRKR